MEKEEIEEVKEKVKEKERKRERERGSREQENERNGGLSGKTHDLTNFLGYLYVSYCRSGR